MEKTKQFIDTELRKYENLFWEWDSKVKEKEKAIAKMQNELNILKHDLAKYEAERDRYQELYDEIHGN